MNKLTESNSLPTLLVMSLDGKKLAEKVGYMDAKTYIAFLDNALQKKSKSGDMSPMIKALYEELQQAMQKNDKPKLISLWNMLSPRLKSKDTQEALKLPQVKLVFDDFEKKINEIQNEAQQGIENAKKFASQEKYQDAIVAAEEVQTQYAGLPEAEEAEKLVEEWNENPEVKQALADQKKKLAAQKDLQIALEAEGRIINGKPDPYYYKAEFFYKQIIREYPNTSEAEEAKQKLATFAKDKKIQKIIKQQRADKEGSKWYNLAKNYVANNRKDLAIPYIDKILKNFPGTTWAKKASDLKAAITK